VGPRASLDGWKISSPTGFDPGPSAIFLYSSQIIVRMMKLRSVRQAENVASKNEGNEKYAQNFNRRT